MVHLLLVTLVVLLSYRLVYVCVFCDAVQVCLNKRDSMSLPGTVLLMCLRLSLPWLSVRHVFVVS